MHLLKQMAKYRKIIDKQDSELKLRREQICDLDSKLTEYTTLFNQFYLKEHARKVLSAKIEIRKEADPILISNEL